MWILCQNSLTRELKIRVVGFVLKKLLTFFENLIVPHALHGINGCFFVFYLIWYSGILFWFHDNPPPPPHLEKKNDLILFKLKNLKWKKKKKKKMIKNKI